MRSCVTDQTCLSCYAAAPEAINFYEKLLTNEKSTVIFYTWSEGVTFKVIVLSMTLLNTLF